MKLYIPKMDLTQAREFLGYPEWRPDQKAALEAAQTGRDGIILIPTGGGKSAIFQALGVMDTRLCLVISPLIALMADQVRSLKDRGVSAELFNSSQGVREKRAVIEAVKAGELDILYVSPERLQSEEFLEILSYREIGLLVVDECHCCLQWGHDFRPDYARILQFRRRYSELQLLAFTATATPTDVKEIKQQLGIENGFEVHGSIDRKNLNIRVQPVGQLTRGTVAGRIMDVYKEISHGTTIIYAGTRKACDALLKSCSSYYPNRNVMMYHGGMNDGDRKKISQRFVEIPNPIVIATNAFGMGIDRADVRKVIHFQMPGSMEAYYQEIGRAGRDGRDSEAVMLHHYTDRRLQDYFIMLAAKDEPVSKTLVWAVEKAKVWTDLHNDSGIAHLQRKGLVEALGNKTYKLTQSSNETFKSPAWKDLISWSSAYLAAQRAKIEKVLSFATSSGIVNTKCRRKFLLEHFGQPGVSLPSKCCDVCKRRG